jgi:hypothetical protein
MEGTQATTATTTNGAAPQTSAEPEIELDDEAKALQLEANKAESRKKIAEAEKASAKAHKGAVQAALPSVDTEPLKGDIEVGTGVGLISDRVAYSLIEDAAARAAAVVMKKLEGQDPRVLVVEDRDLVSSDWAYELVRAQLEASATALEEAKTALGGGRQTIVIEEEERESRVEPSAELARDAEVMTFDIDRTALAAAVVSPVMAAGKALVGASADIAAFFRSDYALSTKAVDIKTTPLTAAICEHVSGAFPIEVDRFLRLNDTGILETFRSAVTCRMEVNQLSASLKAQVVNPGKRRVKTLREELAETSKSFNAEKDDAQRKVLEAKVSKLKKDIRRKENENGPAAGAASTADSLVTGFDQLIEKLTKAPEGGGLPPLASAAIRERLHTGEHPYTHVLYASVESPGGEAIKRKSVWPWWNVMTFMGGAQVSYLLVKLGDNAVKAAGTESVLGTVKLKLSSARARPIRHVDLGRSGPQPSRSPLVNWWRATRTE